MNAKFTLSYDGTAFQGSQTQPNGLSVEDALQRAFKTLNIETKIILSGRTDSNVHATGQVFNCVLPSYWHNLEKLQSILNVHLFPSIKISSICAVSDAFHARFHAKKRVYRYVVSQKALDPFSAKYCAFYENINVQKIKEAIKLFVGVHDFEYFHKTGSEKENTVREIYEVQFYAYKDKYIFKFTANSYLRAQMRLMVAFLLKIGQGVYSKEELLLQLNRQKRVCKTPASPYGLYLAKVIY